MTKEQRAARAELKRIVKELMKDVQKLAIERLEVLMDNSNIVEHHMNSEGMYATPKNFIAALSKEIERQYAHPNPTRATKQRVATYYINM
jgi:hypothetical protein